MSLQPEETGTFDPDTLEGSLQLDDFEGAGDELAFGESSPNFEQQCSDDEDDDLTDEVTQGNDREALRQQFQLLQQQTQPPHPQQALPQQNGGSRQHEDGPTNMNGHNLTTNTKMLVAAPHDAHCAPSTENSPNPTNNDTERMSALHHHGQIYPSKGEGKAVVLKRLTKASTLLSSALAVAANPPYPLVNRRYVVCKTKMTRTNNKNLTNAILKTRDEGNPTTFARCHSTATQCFSSSTKHNSDANNESYSEVVTTNTTFGSASAILDQLSSQKNYKNSACLGSIEPHGFDDDASANGLQGSQMSTREGLNNKIQQLNQLPTNNTVRYDSTDKLSAIPHNRNSNDLGRVEEGEKEYFSSIDRFGNRFDAIMKRANLSKFRSSGRCESNTRNEVSNNSAKEMTTCSYCFPLPDLRDHLSDAVAAHKAQRYVRKLQHVSAVEERRKILSLQQSIDLAPESEGLGSNIGEVLIERTSSSKGGRSASSSFQSQRGGVSPALNHQNTSSYGHHQPQANTSLSSRSRSSQQLVTRSESNSAQHRSDPAPQAAHNSYLIQQYSTHARHGAPVAGGGSFDSSPMIGPSDTNSNSNFVNAATSQTVAGPILLLALAGLRRLLPSGEKASPVSIVIRSDALIVCAAPWLAPPSTDSILTIVQKQMLPCIDVKAQEELWETADLASRGGSIGNSFGSHQQRSNNSKAQPLTPRPHSVTPLMTIPNVDWLTHYVNDNTAHFASLAKEEEEGAGQYQTADASILRMKQECDLAVATDSIFAAYTIEGAWCSTDRTAKVHTTKKSEAGNSESEEEHHEHGKQNPLALDTAEGMMVADGSDGGFHRANTAAESDMGLRTRAPTSTYISNTFQADNSSPQRVKMPSPSHDASTSNTALLPVKLAISPKLQRADSHQALLQTANTTAPHQQHHFQHSSFSSNNTVAAVNRARLGGAHSSILAPSAAGIRSNPPAFRDTIHNNKFAGSISPTSDPYNHQHHRGRGDSFNSINSATSSKGETAVCNAGSFIDTTDLASHEGLKMLRHIPLSKITSVTLFANNALRLTVAGEHDLVLQLDTSSSSCPFREEGSGGSSGRFSSNDFRQKLNQPTSGTTNSRGSMIHNRASSMGFGSSISSVPTLVMPNSGGSAVTPPSTRKPPPSETSASGLKKGSYVAEEFSVGMPIVHTLSGQLSKGSAGASPSNAAIGFNSLINASVLAMAYRSELAKAQHSLVATAVESSVTGDGLLSEILVTATSRPSSSADSYTTIDAMNGVLQVVRDALCTNVLEKVARTILSAMSVAGVSVINDGYYVSVPIAAKDEEEQLLSVPVVFPSQRCTPVMAKGFCVDTQKNAALHRLLANNNFGAMDMTLGNDNMAPMLLSEPSRTCLLAPTAQISSTFESIEAKFDNLMKAAGIGGTTAATSAANSVAHHQGTPRGGLASIQNMPPLSIKQFDALCAALPPQNILKMNLQSSGSPIRKASTNSPLLLNSANRQLVVEAEDFIETLVEAHYEKVQRHCVSHWGYDPLTLLMEMERAKVTSRLLKVAAQHGGNSSNIPVDSSRLLVALRETLYGSTSVTVQHRYRHLDSDAEDDEDEDSGNTGAEFGEDIRTPPADGNGDSLMNSDAEDNNHSSLNAFTFGYASPPNPLSLKKANKAGDAHQLRLQRRTKKEKNRRTKQLLADSRRQLLLLVHGIKFAQNPTLEFLFKFRHILLLSHDRFILEEHVTMAGVVSVRRPKMKKNDIAGRGRSKSTMMQTDFNDLGKSIARSTAASDEPDKIVCLAVFTLKRLYLLALTPQHSHNLSSRTQLFGDELGEDLNIDDDAKEHNDNSGSNESRSEPLTPSTWRGWGSFGAASARGGHAAFGNNSIVPSSIATPPFASFHKSKSESSNNDLLASAAAAVSNYHNNTNILRSSAARGQSPSTPPVAAMPPGFLEESISTTPFYIPSQQHALMLAKRQAQEEYVAHRQQRRDHLHCLRLLSTVEAAGCVSAMTGTASGNADIDCLKASSQQAGSPTSPRVRPKQCAATQPASLLGPTSPTPPPLSRMSFIVAVVPLSSVTKIGIAAEVTDRHMRRMETKYLASASSAESSPKENKDMSPTSPTKQGVEMAAQAHQYYFRSAVASPFTDTWIELTYSNSLGYDLPLAAAERQLADNLLPSKKDADAPADLMPPSSPHATIAIEIANDAIEQWAATVAPRLALEDFSPFTMRPTTSSKQCGIVKAPSDVKAKELDSHFFGQPTTSIALMSDDGDFHTPKVITQSSATKSKTCLPTYVTESTSSSRSAAVPADFISRLCVKVQGCGPSKILSERRVDVMPSSAANRTNESPASPLSPRGRAKSSSPAPQLPGDDNSSALLITKRSELASTPFAVEVIRSEVRRTVFGVGNPFIDDEQATDSSDDREENELEEERSEEYLKTTDAFPAEDPSEGRIQPAETVLSPTREIEFDTPAKPSNASPVNPSFNISNMLNSVLSVAGFQNPSSPTAAGPPVAPAATATAATAGIKPTKTSVIDTPEDRIRASFVNPKFPIDYGMPGEAITQFLKTTKGVLLARFVEKYSKSGSWIKRLLVVIDTSAGLNTNQESDALVRVKERQKRKAEKAEERRLKIEHREERRWEEEQRKRRAAIKRRKSKGFATEGLLSPAAPSGNPPTDNIPVFTISNSSDLQQFHVGERVADTNFLSAPFPAMKSRAHKREGSSVSVSRETHPMVASSTSAEVSCGNSPLIGGVKTLKGSNSRSSYSSFPTSCSTTSSDSGDLSSLDEDDDEDLALTDLALLSETADGGPINARDGIPKMSVVNLGGSSGSPAKIFGEQVTGKNSSDINILVLDDKCVIHREIAGRSILAFTEIAKIKTSIIAIEGEVVFIFREDENRGFLGEGIKSSKFMKFGSERDAPASSSRFAEDPKSRKNLASADEYYDDEADTKSTSASKPTEPAQSPSSSPLRNATKFLKNLTGGIAANASTTSQNNASRANQQSYYYNFGGTKPMLRDFHTILTALRYEEIQYFVDTSAFSSILNPLRITGKTRQAMRQMHLESKSKDSVRSELEAKEQLEQLRKMSSVFSLHERRARSSIEIDEDDAMEELMTTFQEARIHLEANSAPIALARAEQADRGALVEDERAGFALIRIQYGLNGLQTVAEVVGRAKIERAAAEAGRHLLLQTSELNSRAAIHRLGFVSYLFFVLQKDARTCKEYMVEAEEEYRFDLMLEIRAGLEAATAADGKNITVEEREMERANDQSTPMDNESVADKPNPNDPLTEQPPAAVEHRSITADVHVADDAESTHAAAAAAAELVKEQCYEADRDLASQQTSCQFAIADESEEGDADHGLVAPCPSLGDAGQATASVVEDSAVPANTNVGMESDPLSSVQPAHLISQSEHFSGSTEATSASDNPAMQESHAMPTVEAPLAVPHAGSSAISSPEKDCNCDDEPVASTQHEGATASAPVQAPNSSTNSSHSGAEEVDDGDSMADGEIMSSDPRCAYTPSTTGAAAAVVAAAMSQRAAVASLALSHSNSNSHGSFVANNSIDRPRVNSSPPPATVPTPPAAQPLAPPTLVPQLADATDAAVTVDSPANPSEVSPAAENIAAEKKATNVPLSSETGPSIRTSEAAVSSHPSAATSQQPVPQERGQEGGRGPVVEPEASVLRLPPAPAPRRKTITNSSVRVIVPASRTASGLSQQQRQSTAPSTPGTGNSSLVSRQPSIASSASHTPMRLHPPAIQMPGILGDTVVIARTLAFAPSMDDVGAWPTAAGRLRGASDSSGVSDEEAGPLPLHLPPMAAAVSASSTASDVRLSSATSEQLSSHESLERVAIEAEEVIVYSEATEHILFLDGAKVAVGRSRRQELWDKVERDGAERRDFYASYKPHD